MQVRLCQVLELVAETSAPRREVELLLADAPQEALQEDRAKIAWAIDKTEEMVSTARLQGPVAALLHGASSLHVTAAAPVRGFKS